MSEFLLIAPGDFRKVADASVFPYGAEYFETFNGTGANVDITEMFRAAGIIGPEQSIAEVRYTRETGDVWYRVE